MVPVSRIEDTEKPVTFLIHPNEFIPADKVVITRRGKNLFEYVFADIIRQRLKIKNLGSGMRAVT